LVDGNRPVAVMDYATLAEALVQAGVRRNWPIDISVSYRMS
jgi:hypothetical protein